MKISKEKLLNVTTAREPEFMEALEILIIRIAYSSQLPSLETVVKKIKEDNNDELNLDVEGNNIGNDIKKILDAFQEGKILKNSLMNVFLFRVKK